MEEQFMITSSRSAPVETFPNNNISQFTQFSQFGTLSDGEQAIIDRITAERSENPALQLRSAPPDPNMMVKAWTWNHSSIEPDYKLKGMTEIATENMTENK